jgi:hypothetical protein
VVLVVALAQNWATSVALGLPIKVLLVKAATITVTPAAAAAVLANLVAQILMDMGEMGCFLGSLAV